MVADILRRHDRDAGTLSRGDARAIHARAKVRGSYSIDPGKNIGALFGKQTAALFLIEKDYGLRWKSFGQRRFSRRGSVGVAQLLRVSRRLYL